jgi:hypothetical protein
MSQYVNSPTKTFAAGAAIAKYARVKFASDVITTAGVADDWIGVALDDAFASGDEVQVRLRNATGTCKFIAAGAVTSGARVYAAASGKVDDAVTTEMIGVAMEAAGANNDVFEVMPLSLQAYRVARGEVTLDGSNPTPITTGLNTIVAATVTLKKTTSPGDDPVGATVDYTGSDGTLNLYAWKTDGTDPTLVASTNNSAVFCWVAVGT